MIYFLNIKGGKKTQERENNFAVLHTTWHLHLACGQRQALPSSTAPYLSLERSSAASGLTLPPSTNV